MSLKTSTNADAAAQRDLALRINGACVGMRVHLVIPVLLQLAAHFAAVVAVDPKTFPKGVPLKQLVSLVRRFYFEALRLREGIHTQ